VELPELAPGKYKWTAFAQLQDGSEFKAGEGEFEKKDEAKTFPWWNFSGGNAEKVLWPFAAVKAEDGGRVLKAWGKEYRLDGLALPQQIVVTGNTDKWPAGRSGKPEVLAAPVRLDATIGGKPVALKAAGKPKIVSAADHRIALSGTASGSGLKVATATKLEQDGAYFVDLTLAPEKSGQPVALDALDLVIPVRSDVATFLNAFGVTGHGGGSTCPTTPPMRSRGRSPANGPRSRRRSRTSPCTWRRTPKARGS
jgi:hypothetical protein